jgi:putative addiction module killer protein
MGRAKAKPIKSLRGGMMGFACALPILQSLRIYFGPGYRVYFQKRGNTIIVLLCGGDKSTQTKDIKTAKQLAKAWSE